MPTLRRAKRQRFNTCLNRSFLSVPTMLKISNDNKRNCITDFTVSKQLALLGLNSPLFHLTKFILYLNLHCMSLLKYCMLVLSRRGLWPLKTGKIRILYGLDQLKKVEINFEQNVFAVSVYI